MTQPTPRRDSPRRDHEEADEARTGGFLLSCGKVDAEAMRRALDAALEAGNEDDAELRRVTFTLRRDVQKRLDKYLTDRITFMSRTQLQRLIDDGGVLVNQRTPKASTVLRAGDTVEVVVPEPPSTEFEPEEIPLDIMYEDEYMIVLNKQPDIIVHPARSHNSGTMINALAWHFRASGSGALSGVGKDFARPGVVHRLDRHTSGCIVFAKQDAAHWKLGHQFEHRRVDKRYLAVVHGAIEPDVQVINLPIGPHPSREKGYREKNVVRHDELGREAVTICRVRERYRVHRPGAKPEDYTLAELELKTGRTHQIRVHLSYNLWPIVGDDMYGGRPFTDAEGRVVISRQALHACTLGIRHPISDEPLCFTAPLRGELADLVRTLRRMSGGGIAVDTQGATVNLAAAVSPS
ncbi:MAG: RluA family pseudouridine synthase [Phycisphaerae bacterium]|nr:RluA family pseudouridine synthase [Phycisphaerae bacterium]